MWGFGGLTFGLTMRYLGMSLGMGVALGYCAAFGILVPPIFKQFMPGLPVGSSIWEIAGSVPGQVTLAGVAVCLLGIGIAALAGLTKEKEMPAEQKKMVIKEFNFKKGILVAMFSGIIFLCTDGGQSHRRRSQGGGHLHAVDRFAKALRGAGRRLYDELHLVRVVEPQEPHGLSIPRLACRKGTRASRRHRRQRARQGNGNRRRHGGGFEDSWTCTWQASSFSARCGDGFSTNGKAPARRRTYSSTAAL
jgi:hypothetical protein